MKRVLFVSIFAAMFVAACGEKSHLDVKARKLQRDGTNTGKVEGAFTTTKGADTRKLTANSKAARHVVLSEKSVETSVYCTNDLERSLQLNERIYLLGGSQVMILQDTDLDIPENPRLLGQKKADVPQEIVNLVCASPAVAVDKIESFKNVAHINLALDAAATEIEAKFSVANNSVQKARIACGGDEALKNATKIMLAEKTTDNVHILISPESKMLLETSSKKGEAKEYLLITCSVETAQPKEQEEKPAASPEVSQEIPQPEASIEALPENKLTE